MPSFLTEDGQVPELDSVPSYLIAADNHNIGSTKGGSLLDPETWGEKLANGGRLVATGLLSGANSFYNTGAAVANWLGADAELNDTKAWIASLDDDLGKYYKENQQAADLVGFVAGSVLPGMAGIKVLNAGQNALRAAETTGLLGTNLSRATGLLVPRVELYTKLAAADINAATATFSAINQNGIRALMAGVQQNFLEGMAFETAVQASMFKSPILEDQDRWDILKNIATGGVFQGVVGGALSGASTWGKIKKLVTGAEAEVKPWASRVIAESDTSAAERIIMFTEDKMNAIKKFETENTVTENGKAIIEAHTDKIRRIDNDIRSAYHELVGGNTELGNMLADTHVGLPAEQALSNLLGAEQILPLGVISKLEKYNNEVAKGNAAIDLSISHSYVKLLGENAGQVFSEEPAVWNIADRTLAKKGQNLQEAIMGKVRDFGFKPEGRWSAAEILAPSKHYEAEARYIWADKIFKEFKEGQRIDQYDFPLIERALKDMREGKSVDIKLVDKAGGILADKPYAQDLEKHLVAAKQEVAGKLLEKYVYSGRRDIPEGTQAIAKIVNTKLGFIEGTNINPGVEDFFAWQSRNKEYSEWLEKQGGIVPVNKDADTRFLPTYAKIARRAPELKDVNGHVIDGMTWIKQQQKVNKAAVDSVAAKHMGALYEQVPDIPDSLLLSSNRFGAGATVAGTANGGYGSLESTTQFLGSLTKSLKTQFRKLTQESLQAPLFGLLSKQEAAIEFETINQKVTRSAKQWVRYSEGEGEEAQHFLVTKDALKKFTIVPEKGVPIEDQDILLNEIGKLDWDSLNAAMPEDAISIQHPETVNAVDAHIARAGSRTTAFRELRAAQGMENGKDSEVFRPIRQNPKDYPYFAFVKDPRVTGQGHTTMIWANTEGKLAELINKVPQEYKVVTKRDAEDFFRARHEYEYERTLHENYINSDLKSRGVMSDFFTKTDPKKIVDGILQQHLREDDGLAVELMRAKNQKAFDWLEDQGDAYTKISASKLGSFSDRIQNAGKNPYLDYIKTALDISKIGEHPWIQGFNRLLDGAVSRVVANVGEVFAKAKTPEELEKINGILTEYGMNTGYRDAALDLLVNHSAPKGELTKFVRGANAILAKLTLGLDPLNSINNFVGANILRGTELKQITDAIREGNTELAGELGRLAKIELGKDLGAITAPTKLVATALQNFVKDGTNGPLKTMYREAGFIKDISEQFAQILDDFTLQGTENVSQLNKRLRSAFDKAKLITEAGEKYTGNKLAEELNRFISADVMRQITDLGVKHGLLNQQEQLAYINTFVNRVEGNIIASQRPLMFQGPIGQAIGLFQSYQFNLLQQMFRYVAEGSKKDAAMLLGLQGTFYGIQGLPGFQFVNQHVVGTLSGNQKHVDLYDSIYGVAGKGLGDLFVYGLPSNLLRANLYSRGDINPRQVTVIPTQPSEIPFVGAFTKLMGSVKQSLGNIANGGDIWQSMLQGIEHNGLSRPLAGLAQTLQSTTNGGVAFSTTSQGSIIGSNDLMSWATAVRLAGGRPIDEAIVNDGVFRIQAYQQFDRNRLLGLGNAIKSTAIGSSVGPDQEQVAQFAKRYVEYGGKQANFNKFMMREIKAADTSTAQEISRQLQNPFAQKMQMLMGGDVGGFGSF